MAGKLWIKDAQFSLKLLPNVSVPEAVGQQYVEGQVRNGQWSGAMLRSVAPAGLEFGDLPDEYPYQHPGLLSWEPKSGRLSICYGQGRLQDSFGPIGAVPVAEVQGDLDAFVAACHEVQFVGRTTYRVELSSHDSPSGDGGGRTASEADIRLSLGDAIAHARLFSDRFQSLTQQFVGQLPVSGRATNTHSSGPLLRFWNEEGGTQGQTPLEPTDEELGASQVVLYPGHLYYLPKPGYAGLRIATRRATLMRSSTGAGALRLIPLGELVGDSGPFVELSAKLRDVGAQPMRLDALE